MQIWSIPGKTYIVVFEVVIFEVFDVSDSEDEGGDESISFLGLKINEKAEVVDVEPTSSAYKIVKPGWRVRSIQGIPFSKSMVCNLIKNLEKSESPKDVDIHFEVPIYHPG